jgi:thiol-disulfide isomerase/thioredoxin
MIRRLLITLTISIIYSVFLHAEKNCHISLYVDAPNYSGQYLKIGHYFGYQTLLIDSIKADKKGSFAFSDSLHTGIYLLHTPSNDSYEFIITESGKLNIQFYEEDNQIRMQISGNTITEAFNTYLNRVRTMKIQIDSMKSLSDHTETYSEKIAIKRVSKRLIDSVDIITMKYAEEYEGTLLSDYLRALLPINMPLIRIPEQVSNPDSFRWVQSHTYFRKHYLDNVNFGDNGLIYTPVLEDKLTTYLTKIIEQDPESITNAIDTILQSLKDTEVNQYITEMLVDHYSKLKHKAIEEYVFVHLIKDYYLAGKAPWANNRQIGILNDEYNLHKPASLYQEAPKILLPDQYNKQHSLESIQSDYTVVIFWDYECPYCRRAIEDVKKVLLKYEAKNIQAFTVFTGKDLDVWKAFLARKIPQDWINTQLDNKYAIVRMYNISQTPAIFLLGSDKTILSKNLTASALDSYFNKNL